MARIIKEEINMNHKIVREILANNFFKEPAQYYLSFGIVNRVHTLLKQCCANVRWSNPNVGNGFTNPHLYFMRNNEGVTKKGIIIELPRPFFDGDYNYVLLMYVGFKYYYIVSKFDYRNHASSIYQLIPDGDGYKEKYFNIPVDSPQDLWDKCVLNSEISAF